MKYTGENFNLRHQSYLEFVSENTKDISRSKMWEAISDKFIAQLDDSGLVIEKRIRKHYFLEFQKDPGISKIDNMRYKVSRLLEHIVSRIVSRVNNIILGDTIRYRVIFNKLGYYDLQTKYLLKKHPIFGTDKCIHDINLYLQWHNYCQMYPFIKDHNIKNILEIGAGSAILTMLLHHDFSSKVTIIDLPEMITLSSACVNMLFPQANMIFPHEVDETIDFDDYDFILLWPNQAHLIPENHFDLAMNSNSMCEMKKEEIDFYFKLIQKSVRDAGFFYCCNRFRKNPSNMQVGDNETREFFKYPCENQNIDLLIDINRFKYEFTNRSYDHLQIDRLQKIVKNCS